MLTLVVVQSNYLLKVSGEVAAKMSYKLRVPNVQEVRQLLETRNQFNVFRLLVKQYAHTPTQS